MSDFAKFNLYAGSVRGKHHRRANNQDAWITGSMEIDGETFRYGFLVDGCGSGTHSETGAKKGIQFLEIQTRKALSGEIYKGRFKRGHNLYNLPNYLLHKLVRFIEFQTAGMFLEEDQLSNFLNEQSVSLADPEYEDIQDMINAYVREHWLFTVFGFIQGPGATLVFHRGDGAYNVNGTPYYIKQANEPLYPGYFVIPWNAPRKALATKEMTVVELDSDDVELIILGSDSWLDHRDLFGRLPDYLTYPLQLPGQLVKWAEDDIFFDEPDETTAIDAFEDDTTAVALVRVFEEELEEKDGEQ